ncbi:MAG: DUF4375 domain-containing protein [Candidatus Binatus sp.]|jgi:uncharacterized protein DUF4375
MANLKFLYKYSGQTIEQLLSLESEYRIDSLVEVFEQAVNKKIARDGESAISAEERVILAVEGLEREVNNGGYSLFFENSTREFVPIIVQALGRIGCPKTAEITQRAIDSLHLPTLGVEAIDAVLTNGEFSEEELNECDRLYYQGAENISGQLFAFIKTNKNAIAF